MRLSDVILHSSEAALAEQQIDGSFPPGHNGPYYDPETPVRNTAHWLITLLKSHEVSGKRKFREAARRAADYLFSPAARPMEASFFCRRNPEKDFCNGLIGQAWAIEALAVAAKKLEEQKYFDLAKEVFRLHPFDKQAGLWRRLYVDGSYGPFDMTFNHQLWFAAATSMLYKGGDAEAGHRVTRFLDRTLQSHLLVAGSGRIIHRAGHPSKLADMLNSVLNFYTPLQELRRRRGMPHKEIGYHAFNLYAFAILRQHLPAHPLWQSGKFRSLIVFINDPAFIKGLENNQFGFPYNPSGFEVAFTMKVFTPLFETTVKSAEWWVEQQLRRCYDMEENMMSRNTEDPATSSARLYKATRLPDMDLNLA